MAQRNERMVRKIIFMPAWMIKKVNDIAKVRGVSFSQVVRAAVDAYDFELSPHESAFLESMLDTAIVSAQESIRKIDKLEQRLDATHAMLEARTKIRERVEIR